MKTNIFTKILAVSVFTLTIFFGFRIAPASAEVPKNTSDYYVAKNTSNSDLNTINPILDNKNCGKLSLGDVNVIMGDCAKFLWWYTGNNTFYLYKNLGVGTFTPELNIPDKSAADKNLIAKRYAWAKIRDLYGQFSQASEKNGYQYISCKLDSNSKSCLLYPNDKTKYCIQNPTDSACIIIPPTIPDVCLNPQPKDNTFLLYSKCISSDVYNEIKLLAQTSIITGGSVQTDYLALPKQLTIGEGASSSFNASDPSYKGWQALQDFYNGVSLKSSGTDKTSALSSRDLIKSAIDNAANGSGTPPSYCTGEDSSSGYYKDVGGTSTTGGITTGGQFVICFASQKIDSASLTLIQSVTTTAKYYYPPPNDSLVLPQNHTIFQFIPTDQIKEISAWNQIIAEYSNIIAAADAKGTESDSQMAQASILNIRQSIGAGSKLAYTVEGDYFKVDQGYITNLIPPEQTTYLKTNLIKLGLPFEYPSAGVLREVTPTAGTVPAIANDLQADAITSVQNIYTAIANAATNDNTNYVFAYQAQLNLESAVTKYRQQQQNSFFLSPISTVLPDSLDRDAIGRVPTTNGYVAGDTLILPRVITADDIGAIDGYDKVLAWQAIQKAYIWVEKDRKGTQDELDAVQSEINIQAQIETFTGAPGEVEISTDKSTVELGASVNITMKYNNADNEKLKYDLWITDKNVDDFLATSHLSGAVANGQSEFGYIWQTSAGTAKVKHRIVVKIYYSEGLKKGVLKAKGETFVTVVPYGQNQVVWEITPSSQQIPLGGTATIKYTLQDINTGYLGGNMKLYIVGCNNVAYEMQTFEIVNSDQVSTPPFTWNSDPASTTCGHEVFVKIFPPSVSTLQIGKSATCIETYVGSPTNACSGGVAPPTGETTDVDPKELIKIVGDFLGVPLKATNVADFLLKVVEYWFPTLISIAAFFGLIIGGFFYMTSGGDDAKVVKGKKTVIYSIIGLFLAALSYAIVVIIVNLLNNPSP